MSAILILAPSIVCGWSSISTAVASAAAILGLSAVHELHQAGGGQQAASNDNLVSVELEVEQSEVLASSLTGQEEVVLTKAGIKVRVYRDENAQLCVHAEGRDCSKAELEALARQLVEQITQAYIYNRVVTELKQRGIEVQQEEVTEDKTIHLYVNNFLE